ncbi:MAG TPA: HYR domain-containing protein [Gaiellaceae bacterium]|nr:HYR domain-containing protein [Gaiellaceae bacterium]
MNRTTIHTALVLLAAAALVAAAVPAQAASGGDGNAPTSVSRMAASLELRAELRLVSIRDGACPAGVSATTTCPSRTGKGLAPGLGSATVAYSYLVDQGHPACGGGSARILGYPVRLAVAGKGELHIAVAERSDCFFGDTAISVEQAFAITGGTGMYAGAAGSGTVKRALGSTGAGAAGTETWTGTLTVPGLEFDVTRPALAGAANRIVKAKPGAKTARVVFQVTAQDDRDGALATSCTARSGSKFRVGQTRVSCSATDTSANTATAAFTVTVRKAR